MLFAPVLLALASQTPAAPESLARLVPRDTVVYLQVPSLDQLLSAAKRTRDAFDPSSTDPLDAEHFLGDLDIPGAAADIDPRRPLGVCLTLARDPGASPRPVFLLPARSPEAFAKSVSTGEHAVTAIVDGGYVLVAPDASKIERDGAASPIALDLPSGDVVARIDLARLIEQFRPMLDPLLEQIEEAGTQAASAAPGGVDAGPVLGMYMDGLRDFLDSAQTLDVYARLEGERMELDFDLSNKPGSVLAGFASKEKTDMRALARFFDTRSTINVLAGADLVALSKRFRPLYDVLPEVYPEPMRAGMKQMLSHVDELSAQMGSALAAGGDLDSGGMRLTYFLRARDAAKLLETYKVMLTSVPGMIVEPATQSTVEGVPVTSVRMRFDAKILDALGTGAGAEEQQQVQSMVERMYGKDGLQLRLAVKGDVCLLVLGGDEAYLKSALARASAAPQPLPASVQRALDRVGGMSPCFLVHYDIGRMMKGVTEMFGSLAPAMQGELPELPFSILAWGGIEGAVWHGALGCDLGEVGSAMRALETERAARVLHSRSEGEVRAIVSALGAYAGNNAGKYPDSLQVLIVKDSNGAAYLEGEHPLTDPWGREYVYRAPDTGHPKPRVSTLGRDGKPGGLGADADIELDTFE